MKICSACRQDLPKEKFSKKQWQAKQRRRCKECIAENRDVNLEAPKDAPLPDNREVKLSKAPPNYVVSLPLPSSDGECASSWTDEDLFKDPPPRDECPICFLPLPLNFAQHHYQACCGKVLCCGCIDAVEAEDEDITCPFCRTPQHTSDEEFIERMKKRADAGDADAFLLLGNLHDDGDVGFPQNRNKAMQFFLRAGKLGSASAYNKIGIAYYEGKGVERDSKKAQYYLELAAMGGNVRARHNLGILEMRAAMGRGVGSRHDLGIVEKGDGNMSRAMKHWMVSAGAGDDDSLKKIRDCFLEGHATKDDFEKALRAHKESADEMKSDMREAAAALIAVGLHAD